jgi:hypothetical protein
MRKHHFWKFIPLPLCIVLLAVSCTPRPAWVTNVVNTPVCVAPCWNNITPGKTSRDEVSQILKQDSNAFDVSASLGEPWGDVLSWCVGESPCGPGDLSVLSAFDSRGIVQELYLRPGSPLYLKDFMPLYGPPEKVAFSDTLSAPGNIVVGLLYPKSGLVLEFLSTNQGTFTDPAVDFREDLEVSNIIYSLPGLGYYYSTNIVAKTLDKFDWKGFTHYP